MLVNRRKSKVSEPTSSLYHSTDKLRRLVAYKFKKKGEVI